MRAQTETQMVKAQAQRVLALSEAKDWVEAERLSELMYSFGEKDPSAGQAPDK
jgi:hypothetical protein